jgi:hypothetical protein
MKRFNDFYKLKTEIGSSPVTIDTLFPPTHNFFHKQEKFIKKRRALLAAWLQAVLKHCEIKTSWAAPLLKFLGTSGPGVFPGDEAKKTLIDLKAKLDEAVGVANETMSETMASIKEVASPILEKASQTASETATSIKETASPYLEKVSQTAAETATSLKETLVGKVEEAKKYLITAEEANANFIVAKEKYEEAVSAKEKSEVEGAAPSVIKAAQEHIEALKADMVELGERAAEEMVNANDAMEDIEDLTLEASAGEVTSNCNLQ